MGAAKKKEKSTDLRFQYLEPSKTGSRVGNERWFQLKFPDGRIESNLTPADIDRRIRSKELTGMEWISEAPGGKWVRIIENQEFCDLILHGLERGDFQGAPRRRKKRFTKNTKDTVSDPSEQSPPAVRQWLKNPQQKTQVFELDPKENAPVPSVQVEIDDEQYTPASSFARIQGAPPGGGYVHPKDIAPTPESRGVKINKKKLLLYAAAVLMLAALWWARQSRDTAISTARIENLPASWAPIYVDHAPPLSKEKDTEKFDQGLKEAKTYYYRDTSFFYRAALKSFKALLPSDVQSPTLVAGMVESYLALSAFSPNQTKYFQDLHRTIDRALEVDPYSATLKRAKAGIFLKEGNLLDATRLIKESLSVDGQNPEALLLAAKISDAGGYSEAAEKLLTQAVASSRTLVDDGSPYFTALHVAYARALFKKGLLLGALEQLNTALSINPIHPEAYLLKARIAAEQGKLEDALTFVEQSTALSFFGTFENAAEARFFKGELYERLDQKNRALLEYQQAHLLDPTRPEHKAKMKEKNLSPLEIERTEIVKIFSDATYFIKTGRALLEKDKLSEALAQLEIAKLMDPTKAEIFYLIGQIVERTNDFTRVEEAINAYEKASELDPKMIEPHVRLGDLYRRYFLFDKAYTHLKKALEIYPGSPEANFFMGRLHEERSNGVEAEIRKAIEYYDAARMNAPDNRDAVIRMCELAEKLGILPDAEAFYRRYLGFFPDDLEMQLRLSINRAMQGRKAVAVKSIRELMKKHDTPLVEGALGLAYIASKDYNRGVDILKRAVDKAPKNQWMRRRLAETYTFLGRLSDAVTHFKAMSIVDPSDAFGFFKAGLILYENNNLEPALIEFKNAETVNYRYPLVHAYMADIYQKLNNPNEAAVALKKEIQKNPKLVKYRIQLAELFLRYNYLDESAEVLLEALKMEEKNLQLLYLITRVRREQGMRDVKNNLGAEKLHAALKFARLGLSYYPDAGKLFLEKGLVYRELGDSQQARDNLELYINKDPLALDKNQVLKIIEEL